MGRRFKQTFFQRSHASGQQAHQKMLNITNHQRNANPNHSEISPHTSQNDYHQNVCKWQMLERVWKKEKLTTLWECKLVQSLWKTECRFLPAFPLLGIYLEEMKTLIQKDACTQVFIVITMIAKTWREPKCPSTENWLKRMWRVYYLAIERNKILPFSAARDGPYA